MISNVRISKQKALIGPFNWRKTFCCYFVMFDVPFVGSRVFDPLTLALINLVEFRYYSIAGERILNLLNEPEMSGTQDAAGTRRYYI